MTAAQMRLYNEIKENPGIRFGFSSSHKARMARRLAEINLVRWDDHKHGWFVQNHDVQQVTQAGNSQ